MIFEDFLKLVSDNLQPATTSMWWSGKGQQVLRDGELTNIGSIQDLPLKLQYYFLFVVSLEKI